MPTTPNCPEIQKNIQKLKTLKQEFLLEMKRIKKDGKAGKIYELKEKIEKTKDFLDQELKDFILNKKEKEKKEQKGLEKYLVEGKENTLDLTEASQELKDSLINWDGTIIDNSKKVNYPNLVEVGGSLDTQNAQTFTANSLQSVGGSLYTRNAQTFSADSLKRVGGSLSAQDAQTFTADSLQSVGGFLDTQNAQNFAANSLQSVGGYLDTPNAQTFTANSLQSVGESLYAPSAQTFSADSLESVGGYLDTQNVQNFSADSLKRVGGWLYAQNAQTFSAETLNDVNKIILNKQNFKNYFKKKFFGKIFRKNEEFYWQQAEIDNKLILPEVSREKVKWWG